MCHTCPLLFLNRAHRVASRAKILPSEIMNSSHTALLLSHDAHCLQHSGGSINICYGKRESQPASQQGWMEVLSQPWVLPVLPSLLGGHFFRILASQYSICPARLAHSLRGSFPWSPLCFRGFCLFPLKSICSIVLGSYSHAGGISHHFVEMTWGQRPCHSSWDPSSGLCTKVAFIRC